jgi:hypothetical protein
VVTVFADLYERIFRNLGNAAIRLP